jgi:Chaperone of endosialidase
MASTYSTNLKIDLMGTGDQDGTWGTVTNTNLGTLIEQAISGYVTQAITDGSGANTTITIPDGTTGVARNMFIEMTGALTFSTTSLIVPVNKKLYFIYNNTTGGFAVTVKVTGLTGVSVPNGRKVILVSNGTDIVEAHNAISGNATVGGTLVVTGATTASSFSGAGTGLTGTAAGLTAGNVTTNANLTGPITSTGNATAVAAQTGTGSTFVMQASPALTTPNLGTPSAGTLTNCTFPTLNQNTTGSSGSCTGNAATASTSSALTNGGTLNTPVSGTLTNCTGLPIVAGTTGTLSVARGGTGVVNSVGTGNYFMLNTNPVVDGSGIGYPDAAAYMGVGPNKIAFGYAGVDVYVSVDNAASGVFVSLSDYRIKKDVRTLSSNATYITNAIRVVDYEVLELDGTQAPERVGIRRAGVIAHEIQALIPNAASGTKDAVNADGSPRYQSVNYDAVVPFLIKTIQELTARIEKLEG